MTLTKGQVSEGRESRFWVASPSAYTHARFLWISKSRSDRHAKDGQRWSADRLWHQETWHVKLQRCCAHSAIAMSTSHSYVQNPKHLFTSSPRLPRSQPLTSVHHRYPMPSRHVSKKIPLICRTTTRCPRGVLNRLDEPSTSTESAAPLG